MTNTLQIKKAFINAGLRSIAGSNRNKSGPSAFVFTDPKITDLLPPIKSLPVPETFRYATYLAEAFDRFEKGDYGYAEGSVSVLSKTPRLLAALDVPMDVKFTIAGYYEPESMRGNDRIGYSMPHPYFQDNFQGEKNRAAIDAVKSVFPQIGVMVKSQLGLLIDELRTTGEFDQAFNFGYHVGYLRDNKKLRAFVMERGQPDIDFKETNFQSARELATQRGDQDVLQAAASYGLPQAGAGSMNEFSASSATPAARHRPRQLPLHRIGPRAMFDPRLAGIIKRICRKGQNSPAVDKEVEPPTVP